MGAGGQLVLGHPAGGPADQVDADVDLAGRPLDRREQRVERGHAVDVGRGDVEARGEWLIAPRLIHPTRSLTAWSAPSSRCRCRPSLVTATPRRGRRRRRARSAPVRARRRRPPAPPRSASALPIFRSIRPQSPAAASVASSLSTRTAVGLELGRPRLRVGGLDRQHVRVDLVGEVHRHEHQPGPQRPGRSRAGDVDARPAATTPAPPHRRRRRAASASSGDRSIVSPRRFGLAESARLHAGVVGVQPAAGRQPQRELVVELVDGRLVDDHAERCRPPTLGRVVGPQPAVQVRRLEPVLVVARPLDAAQLVEPARRTCRRASATASAARPTRARPLVAGRRSPSRDRAGGRGRAGSAMSSRASPGGSSALRTRCTRRSELVTVPLLSHHDAEPGSTTSASCAVLVRKMSCTTRWSRPSSSCDAWCAVGLRLGRVLADHVERPQVAAAHRREHLGQVPAVAGGDGRRPTRPRTCPRLVVLDVLEARAACSAGRPCRRRPARCSGRAAG